MNAFLCSRVFSFPLINIHFYNFSDIFSSILTPVFSTKTNGATVVSLGFYLQGEFVSSGVSRLLLFFFFSFFLRFRGSLFLKLNLFVLFCFFSGNFYAFLRNEEMKMGVFWNIGISFWILRCFTYLWIVILPLSPKRFVLFSFSDPNLGPVWRKVFFSCHFVFPSLACLLGKFGEMKEIESVS